MVNKKFKYSEDDYIIAAINIYLDIILIFLKILELFGDKKWVAFYENLISMKFGNY